MKKLLIPAVLLAAATSYGQLSTAAGTRLTDYQNWFEVPFAVTSDANYLGVPYPASGQPAPFVEAGVRTWSGWSQNWGASSLMSTFPGSFTNLSSDVNLKVEIIFLGETAGWWDDWGYEINGGLPQVLANSVQTVPIHGAVNRWFGDYTYITLTPGQSLDVFVTGSGVLGDNPSFPTVGSQGGKYYTYDYTDNLPNGSDYQSYWGTVTPLSSAQKNGSLDAYTVMAFEDIRRRGSGRDNDFNDFIFAFRAIYDEPQAPVPEPSTYGLIGAATLLGFVGYRRFKKKA